MPSANEPLPSSMPPDIGPSAPCPKCGQRVASGEATCAGCGVDVVLAAVLLERRALSVLPAEPGMPFVGDAMLSRFGEFLMKKGYITAAQLEAGLGRQRDMVGRGVRETLGQVLLEMGVLTREQLELASVEQVQELQNALRQANAQLEQRVADRTRELQEAYRRLTELDQLKGNFISNVSHELRTPLTKIKGFHALLAAGDLGPLTADQEQGIEVMGRGVAELERLVGDLIQFATGARGEMALQRSVVAVGELLEGVAAPLGDVAAGRGLSLSCRAPSPAVRVTADAERIRWVVNQLLDNAIKFTPGGGSIEVGATAEAGRVRIWVADTGVGIAEDRVPELFEAFHQLDGSATRRQGGTGLGLALVRMIVSAHDSTVVVDTRLGQGSRFSFDLPAAPASA
jgi:signal transduction histidine kinase